MNTPQAAVQIRGLSKRFGDYVAVDRVDLDVRQGEFFSVLGPSGCGKSTLLRIVAGLEWPDEGSLLIGGADVAAVPAHRRDCNMVFQNYAVFPHLTVSENVAYGLRNLKLRRTESKARVAEILGRVQLTGLESRKPDQLSGGQRQRVALARALVRRPQVLLLDEPLAALDKALREQMQVELRALQQTVGITFVLVTHDQEEALSMSDRIAVMSAGRILQVAEPLTIYEQPNSTTVARFIGDMNFLPAVTESVASGQAAVVAVDGLGRIPLGQPIEADRPGVRHLVAVRPEKLRLSTERAEADVCVRCTVISRSYWGDQSQFQVTVDGCDRPLVVAAHNAGAPRFRLPAAGDSVWLSADRSVFLRFNEPG